jgi:murein DD-endopeptidase MepM/ murein hydrolase activator NlpD
VITADEQNEIDASYLSQLQALRQQHQQVLAQRDKKNKEIVATYEQRLDTMLHESREAVIRSIRERKEIDALYRKKLDAMHGQFTAFAKELGELNKLKDKFLSLATPAPLKNNMTDSSGRGGPWRPVDDFKLNSSTSLADDMDLTDLKIGALTSTVQHMQKSWLEQYQLLIQLPIGAPLPRALGLNSNFGMRIDPITRSLAQHSGIDFVAKIGTPILAAGQGTVSRAGWDGAYGLSVEITHEEGYVSKYGHARVIDVIVGQKVTRGQKIAEVGMTGRTTGAHLHFEILRRGQFVNPMQVLVVPGLK